MSDVAEQSPHHGAQQTATAAASSVRWLKKRRLAGEERERAVRALVFPEIRF